MLARIPVGTPDLREEGARDIAVTSNAARAYASLEYSGRVALIDLMTLRQVDTRPQPQNDVDIDPVDPINLRAIEPQAHPPTTQLPLVPARTTASDKVWGEAKKELQQADEFLIRIRNGRRD